jgi:thiosulfate reductase/polysulfide reductase chain A
MAIFQALGGGIDTKGGLVFGKKLPLKAHETIAPMYAQAEGVDVDRKKGKPGYADCAIVSGGGSWIAFRNRVLEKRAPYPIRGLFIYKHNPVLNMPNRKKTEEFLKMLDLVVAIDTMPSDTVMFADVVLPECTYLERTDPVKTFGGAQPAIAQRNKVIDPMFETKPVIEILRGLTQKISKPLFEITKKYDEDVQDDIADRGEAEVYKDFDLTQPFIHSQEELNEHAVKEIYGEEAVKALKEKGVYYPDMDKLFKQLDVNNYEYYPENKRYEIAWC